MKNLLYILLFIPLLTQAQLPATPGHFTLGIKYNLYVGKFSSLPKFDTLDIIKSDTISNFKLPVKDTAVYYAVRFKGFVNVPVDGIYKFYTTSDDGTKLYIDSQLIVINDGQHDAIERFGNVNLKAGKHLIEVEYFQGWGYAVLDIEYEGPGIIKKPIPASELFTLVFKYPIYTPVPVIMWLSDTSTYSTGTFKSSTPFIKKKGFILYKIDDTDSLNTLIKFEYLDEKRLPLEKKYCVLLSKEINGVTK